MSKYQRLPNETDEELVYRIGSLRGGELGTWQEVADVLNEILGTSYTECKFRKEWHNLDVKKIVAELSKKETPIKNSVSHKKKSKNNRGTGSENTSIAEMIANAISSMPPVQVPDLPEEFEETDSKEWVLLFGDLHYGAEFSIRGLYNEIINEYSPRICEERMWKLAAKVIQICNREGVDKIRVFCLADCIDGVFAASRDRQHGYGIVESVMRVSELLANFLNKLSEYADITFALCMNGNHDIICPDNNINSAFRNENIDRIILFYLKERLENNPHITFLDCPTGNIYDVVGGYGVLCVHGEFQDENAALSEYNRIYGSRINYLFGGHLHHRYSEEVGAGRYVERVPSIVGTNESSIRERKVSDPGATFVCFEPGMGLTQEYRICLP